MTESFRPDLDEVVEPDQHVPDVDERGETAEESEPEEAEVVSSDPTVVPPEAD